jgi:hypothetical protein
MEYIVGGISTVVLIIGVLIFGRQLQNQEKIEEAVKKQKAEDARLRQKYNFTTYEDEKKLNDQLKYEYETLRLREENKRLQEEINKLKYDSNKQ